jgi:hypothetical protein
MTIGKLGKLGLAGGRLDGGEGRVVVGILGDLGHVLGVGDLAVLADDEDGPAEQGQR